MSYSLSETEEIQVSSLISVASPADEQTCKFEGENEILEIPISMKMEVNDPLDPATYKKKLTEHEINLALRLEEFKMHDSFAFPSVNNWKYSQKWCYCKLPDGSMRERKSLFYSKKEDTAFCLHCLILALSNQNQQSIWSTTGYKGMQWETETHESSKTHLSSQIAKIQLSSQKRINNQLSDAYNDEVQHKREVLPVIVADKQRWLHSEQIYWQ